MNDFQKEYELIKSDIDMAVERVLRSGWYILGNEGIVFEQKFANYCDSKFAIGVANGLEALQIALLSIGVGKGDEVITVSNSAVATALAITNCGATPVFVDIDEYFHLDPSKLSAAIGNKTKAIIPVHLFGQSVDLDSIIKIATERKIPVIEDACQAHGAMWKMKKVGSFGTLGCFSFYPTKNLGAYGDGGAIVTNDETLFETCKKLRNYGQSDRYKHRIKGINSRLDEIQAAILSAKLVHLDGFVRRRRDIAQKYFHGLYGIEGLDLPAVRGAEEHSFHLFVIKSEKRDLLQKYLKQYGIETIVHYPIPIHKQECFQEYSEISLPMTESMSSKILSLPISPTLTDDEVDKIIFAIRSFFAESL